jgi:hypothetical protein
MREDKNTVTCEECGDKLPVGEGKNPLKVLSGHKLWCRPGTKTPAFQTAWVVRLRRLQEKRMRHHRSMSDGEDVMETDNDVHLANPEVSCPALVEHDVFSSMECGLENSSPPRIADIDGRLRAAEKLAAKTDIWLSQLRDCPSIQEGCQLEGTREDCRLAKRKEAIERFCEIQAEFNLKTRVTKRILAWVNKYLVLPGEPKFSLPPNAKEASRPAEEHILPHIPTQTDVVCFGKGLPSSPVGGYHCNLTYCDPLSIIARRVVAILHRYGRTAFQVASASSEYETAQQSELLRKADRLIGDPEALIVPIKICADGAHMRGNGLHHITPIMASVIHRYAFEDHTYPDLVTCVIPQGSKLNSSLHHGILDALFGPLRSLYNKMKQFYVLLNNQKIRCYPIIYRMAMDMPMVATCSLTKLSRPAVQSYPCQQCLTKGGSRSYFLPPALPASYRTEAEMVKIAMDESNHAGRQLYCLRRIGEPMFIGMCPFDTRGVFLLVAADGLHAFQGMWFRGIANLALYAFYKHKDMPNGEESDNISEAVSLPPNERINQYEEGSSVDFANESSSSDSEFDYLPSSGDESENDSSTASDEEGVCEDTSDEEGFRRPPGDRGDCNLGLKRRRTNENLGVLAIGDVAKRITTILGSQRGQALVARADRLVRTLQQSKGTDAVPMRHYNVLRQLSKIQEHRYSLGHLMCMMAIIGCDTSRASMGKRFRQLWLAVACKCIRVYALLYQRRPTTEGLRKASKLIDQLLGAVEELEQAIGFEWWPPKKHLLLHFPDMIRLFGRMRLFDTAEGENGISIIKHCYKTISNRDIMNHFEAPLLERMDDQCVASLMAAAKSNKNGGGPSPSTPNGLWSLHKNPFARSIRFKMWSSSGSVVLHSEPSCWPATTFPLKFDEPRSETMEALKRATRKYMESKYFADIAKPSGLEFELYYHAAAKKVDASAGNMTICASNARYGRPRYDFISYKDSRRYGQLIALASIEIDRDRQAVAFISALQSGVHRDSNGRVCPCIDFDGILIHGRTRRVEDGSRAIECVPLSDIDERVTAFEDTSADRKRPSSYSDDNISRTWPHGEWYFIVAASTFHGVEHYN